MTPTDPYLAAVAWGLLVLVFGLDVLVGWLLEWWKRRERRKETRWK